MRAALAVCLVLGGCVSAEPDAGLEMQPYDPLPLVDPMLGTGGEGAQIASVNPGASWPVGMVLVGPDTRGPAGAVSFYHCAGYHYPDTQIMGFSHTHGHGIGVTDYGAVQVMPRARFDVDDADQNLRAAPFSHETEQTSPGFYGVTLDDDGTQVSLTATPHGALHTYRFAEAESPTVWVDLGQGLGGDEVSFAELELDPSTGGLTGVQVIQGGYSARFGGLRTYFAAVVEPAPVEVGVVDAQGVAAAGALVLSDAAGAGWMRFAPGTTEVRLRLAISYVDREGAAANLEAELADATEESVLAEVEQAWRARLGRVRVLGGSEEDRVIFHTAHYHALLMPHVITDVDGQYRGLDGEVHVADFGYQSDLSLWDTFRTLHPLWVLAHPDLQRDAARSLVRMAEDGGSLPRWPLAHGYTGGMVGTPATMVLADTALAGIDGWDEAAGFAAALAAAQGPTAHASRDGIQDYLSLGYVPSDTTGASASKTLEYSWADCSLATWAAARGEPSAEALLAQSMSWKNVWDPAQRFFVQRDRAGSFEQLASETTWSEGYTEGNAMHYRYGAACDPGGMVAVQDGGDVAATLAGLRAYLDGVRAEPDDNFPDDLYWHGNEPVLHVPALGSLLGDPQLSSDFVRHVLKTRYGVGPTGLDGNDDAGTLSAWAMLSMMGLSPVAGTGTWALTAPVFELVELDGQDGTLSVSAPGASRGPLRVHGVRLGETRLDRAYVHSAELLGSGELAFELGMSASNWQPNAMPAR